MISLVKLILFWLNIFCWCFKWVNDKYCFKCSLILLILCFIWLFCFGFMLVMDKVNCICVRGVWILWEIICDKLLWSWMNLLMCLDMWVKVLVSGVIDELGLILSLICCGFLLNWYVVCCNEFKLWNMGWINIRIIVLSNR